MSKRTVRINELMMQEISDIIHTKWRSETICVTITGVSVSPDLRNASINYSMVGPETQTVPAISGKSAMN
jgi:ribosome-binding factor A